MNVIVKLIIENLLKLHENNKLLPIYHPSTLILEDKTNLNCPLERKIIIWDPVTQYRDYVRFVVKIDTL